jgi:LytTr DNA-binding domain
MGTSARKEFSSYNIAAQHGVARVASWPQTAGAVPELDEFLDTAARTQSPHRDFCEGEMQGALQPVLGRIAAERLAHLLQLLADLQAVAKRPRLALKANRRIVLIDLSDVSAIKAEGNYVLLLCKVGSHLLRESISALEDRLEPYGFIRVHRSVLINAALVEEIRPLPTGEYALRLKGGHDYTVTRTYKKRLKSLAQLWIGTDRFFDSL